MPDTKKPLPALPLTNLSTLNIEARAHRGRLVRYLLAESADASIQTRLEGWVYAIEEALDDFSRCVGHGEWLAGVRRRREVKCRARLTQDKTNDSARAPSPSPKTQETLEDARSPVQKKLQQLREHISHSATPSPEKSLYHLLLCLAPCGLRVQDSSTDTGPTSIGCSFASSKFLLPPDSDMDHIETAVLYGLHEWDENAIPPPRIIGGTFSFKGLETQSQHTLLAQTLRIAIYIHLSLLLEQHFLSDSHVHLKFPRPKFSFPSPSDGVLKPSTSAPSRVNNEGGDSDHDKPRGTFIPPGILSFFSRNKKPSSLLFGAGRSQTVQSPRSSSEEARASLDLISPSTSDLVVKDVPPRSPRTSIDSSQGVSSRLGRFISGGGGGGHERKHSLRRVLTNLSPHTPAPSPASPTPPQSLDLHHPHQLYEQHQEEQGPFTQTLNHLLHSQTHSLLSTSPGISFGPPHLLIELAGKEKRKPFRRLKGDERAALSSILGWAGSGTTSVVGGGVGGMRGALCGVGGFVRQQGVSVLVSRHVPVPVVTEEKEEGVVNGLDVSGKGGSGLVPPGKEKEEVSESQMPTPTPSTIGIDAVPGSGLANTASMTTVPSTSSTISPTSTPTPSTKPLPTNPNLTPYTTLPSSSSPPSSPSNHTLCCGRPSYQTFTYFSSDYDHDMRLGEVVLDMIVNADNPCTGGVGGGKCGFKVGEHEVRYMHAGVRVSATVALRGEGDGGGWDWVDDVEVEGKRRRRNVQVEMWESCRVCKRESRRRDMSDGTLYVLFFFLATINCVLMGSGGNSLLSYAKFLEISIYASSVYNLSPAICEHTTPEPPPPMTTTSTNATSMIATTATTATNTATATQLGMGHMNGVDGEQRVRLSDSRVNLVRHFGLKKLAPSGTKTSTTTVLDDQHKATATSDSSIKSITPMPPSPILSFSVSRVENIFELRVPRLQINGGQELERERELEALTRMEREREGGEVDVGEEKKRVLRREIKRWWEGVGDHIDKLELVLDVMSSPTTPTSSSSSVSSVMRQNFKKLPRLPSVDDAYEDFSDDVESVVSRSDVSSVSRREQEEEGEEDVNRTPRPRAYKELEPEEGSKPPQNTPVAQRVSGGGGLGLVIGGEEGESEVVLLNNEGRERAPSIVLTASPTALSSSDDSASTITTTTTTTDDTTDSAIETRSPLELLSNLRQQFLQIEHSLYAQLVRTPEGALNDVRRMFLSCARGAQKRLGAWQRKHLGKDVWRECERRRWDEGEVERLVRDLGLSASVGASASREVDVKGKEVWKAVKASVEEVRCEEPEWWSGACHALPGSSVVVREDDWGSVIAFALSSQDYQREVANIGHSRTTPSTPQGLPGTPPASRRPSTSTTTTTTSTSAVSTPGVGTTSSSFFTTTTGRIFGTSTSATQPDPDKDDIIWHELEPYSAVISRKEHPRDPTSLLSIRDVLRHKSPASTLVSELGSGVSSPVPQGGSGSGGNSGSGGGGNGGLGLVGQNESSQVNLAVYAKPDVGVSMAAVGGEFDHGGGKEASGSVSSTRAAVRSAALTAAAVAGVGFGMGVGAGTTEGAGAGGGRAIHELEAVVAASEKARSESGNAMGTSSMMTQARPVSPFSGSQLSVGSEGDSGQTARGRAASIVSLGSELAKVVNSVGGTVRRAPPTPPPKDEKGKSVLDGAATPNTKELPATPAGSTIDHQPTPSTSSFTNTIANGLNLAMRYVLNQPEARLPVAPPPPVPKKPHHDLLYVDLNKIDDDRPHIKYDWTIGKRLKFSCTVYYAKQFELMRKRCGVDDTFLKSLERSLNWVAVGGKSRSNFWKTEDERFIIKTLVNAWNVADLQVLIELGPSYFKYIESTASRASVLAKLVGFYTIEIRNLETGAVQSKADLLVMENLFYNRKINKTFDLKGVQGRKVKTKQGGGGGGSGSGGGVKSSRTLFDGEWIEGQQRMLVLLQPHSKAILREALRNDADFLAKSNIMDYSLLLGVDEEKKQIACGLVDTIGSYTFAKTLEYKAKHNLQSGKDVTVIPPVEYQERFVNALEGYFLACPDKWSKPVDEERIMSDPFMLPSVL
ncbi:hypothetical protein D9756_009237 [Leucocoprinus leucothites]|uniref:PIPK domain-containing protein n=1 Tax=Leucocoprinus leucothites TaxID=201217 RepID=A0A8H5CZG8_9AGAR|nr:hypothetical protein D9756_009237 [Leucoagaricus leucothites]